MSEGFITLNNREIKLLKAYMYCHSWEDLLVSYPNEDKLMMQKQLRNMVD